jgi:hypothetical protein
MAKPVVKSRGDEAMLPAGTGTARTGRPAKLYRRLTRNATRLGNYVSLWLAPDHLMIVRSTGYNENYARLQLADLKGIFLTGTGRRMWWGIFWGIIGGWAGIVLAITLVNRETPIFSAFFFALGAGGFLWNHLLGPGCRAYVLTGVQTAELPSLVRFKKARRILAQLEPLVAAAQADLVVAVPPVPTVPVAEGSAGARGAEAASIAQAIPPEPPPTTTG